MKRLTIVAVVVLAIFAVSFLMVTAQEEYADEMGFYYDDVDTTDCLICHFHDNGDTDRNPYGVQYEAGMAEAVEITTYENQDADGDGYTNAQELAKGTNPGDFTSSPSRKYTKCVSFILSKEDDGDSRKYIVANDVNKRVTKNVDDNIFFQQVEIDAPCYIKNDKSMVPLRAGIENLGGTVGWDGGEKRVDIFKNGKLVGQMWIGRQYAKINGKNYDLVTAPEIVNSRTFVPVKGVGDSLGAKLIWTPFGQIASFVF